MIYKIIFLAALILLGQILIPSYASAPESIFGQQNPFNNPYVDVKLLDAYFGTSGQKMEVQPGDKNVPFTVVFSNTGTDDISGIKGQLSLPLGFSPTNGNGPLIEADNTQTATSGQSFALTFFVDLDKNTSIKQYSGTVQVTYSRVRENGIHNSYIDFNFKVTGKGVLNIKAENPFLEPASNNQVTVQVSNAGTAPISNIDIVLQNTQTSIASNTQSTTNLQNAVIDQNKWNIGTVVPNSANTFSFNIFIPQSLAGQTLHTPVNVTYFDGQGNQITESKNVDFIVGPASTASTLRISTASYLTMGIMQNLTLDITNLSASKISDISISITPNSSDFKILQDTKWYVKEINPLEKTKIDIPVFADQNIVGQAVNFDVNIQYTKEGSTVIEKQNLGTYIRGLINPSIYGVNVIDLNGQKTIIGNILNQGNIKGVFGTITIEPLDNSNIKKSTQYIGDLDIDAPVPFNVPVEFSGQPTFGENKILVTLTYKDSLLQDHTITQEDSILLPNTVTPTNNNLQIQLVILVAIAGGIGGILFKMGKIKIPAVKKVKQGSS